MTLTLPDGTKKEITAEKLNLIRNAFRSGNFPPPPVGWEKEVWEAGCLKAIDPPAPPVGDHHLLLADRLTGMCDKAVGEHERFEIRPDGRSQLVTGNGPHPWGSDVRIKVSNGHGPPGYKPCVCSYIRRMLESAIKVHPMIDGCVRVSPNSPLLRQVGRNTVVRAARADLWWGHFRGVLGSGSAEPHMEWRVLTDGDLTEAVRFKRFGDDDDRPAEQGDESLWEAVVPPANVVLLPLGKPGRKDPVHEAVLTRVGKGRPTWLVLVDGWSGASAEVRKITSAWETVVLE